MINRIFDLCVVILKWMSALFGTTYETVNVWVFCVIWPILTLLLLGTVIAQHHKITALQEHASRSVQ
jgi:hypothetical protein